MKDQNDQFVVVTGVIGADIHCIGLRILEHALRGAGIRVVSLGIMTPQKEFVEAAVECDADAILVSSLYGHAQMDARGLREKCIEAGIGDVLLYVGGNLAIGIHEWESIESAFKAMQFDRVFPPGAASDTAVAALQQDVPLARSKKARQRSGAMAS